MKIKFLFSSFLSLISLCYLFFVGENTADEKVNHHFFENRIWQNNSLSRSFLQIITFQRIGFYYFYQVLIFIHT